jgi:hypothetical protein
MLTLGTASAAIRRVPADHGTVSAAIAAATPGDTIAVGPGTYGPQTGETLPLTLDKSGLTLLGAGMGLSILQGNAANSVVVCNTASGGRGSGFSITNGAADRGGGINVLAGDFQIDHNLLQANAARRRGAAIYVGGTAQP